MTERIGVIGAGYVGLVTGVCFAALGHQVTLRDIDPAKVEALLAGESPIYEPGLEELMAAHRERLAFTLSLEELLDRADLVFIAVDTPPTYSGDADLSRVMGLLDELQATGAEARHTLIMKSTVPVGTGERVRAELAARGLEHVGYCSNPEFLKEGAAIADFMKPDRVVVGEFDPARGDRVAALYRDLGAPVMRTTVATAEMVKYASNAFLATKISFINEIANVCEEVGADVAQVAEGMGMDRRIGPAFLQAGIGFGGSCLVGGETVLVRRRAGGTALVALDELFRQESAGSDVAQVVVAEALEVLAWRPGAPRAEFLPVAALTRRQVMGEVVEVRTTMGRRVTCTADHPMVVATGPGGDPRVRLAGDLDEGDWLPIALGLPEGGEVGPLDVRGAIWPAGLDADDVIVRPAAGGRQGLGAREVARGIGVLDPPRGAPVRAHDVVRAGSLRLRELDALGLPVADGTLGTARNGTYVPARIVPDERFWRVAGLYAAEGHLAGDGARRRLMWSFHPTDEQDLVDEVAGYWRSLGVKATVRRAPTAMNVSVSSRILAAFWTGHLGLGTNCTDQRVPDLLWSAPVAARRAFLAGAWRGDGSWSVVNHGPSVVLEYGTVSRDLADGLLRLLGGLGVVARLKVGRTPRSTRDTYWLVVAGADQVEGLLDLVDPPARDRITASLARLTRRIAPTGYRRDDGTAWVRVTGVTRRRHDGPVYSLEVPGPHTFVTTAGLVVHNCFPKDVTALKQLAGNSGYHFQLLTSVIEVNELQKRRVVGKLKRHLGPLEGTHVALLGLAFKPETDDMREASSLVLASRLLAEGAHVRVFDPVALDVARERLHGVRFCESAEACLEGADAAVLVTEWRQIVELDWPALRPLMNRPVLVDGRNALDADAMREAGFTYEGIGRAVAR